MATPVASPRTRQLETQEAALPLPGPLQRQRAVSTSSESSGADSVSSLALSEEEATQVTPPGTASKDAVVVEEVRTEVASRAGAAGKAGAPARGADDHADAAKKWANSVRSAFSSAAQAFKSLLGTIGHGFEVAGNAIVNFFNAISSAVGSLFAKAEG